MVYPSRCNKPPVETTRLMSRQLSLTLNGTLSHPDTPQTPPSQAPPHAYTASYSAFSSSRPIGRLRTTSVAGSNQQQFVFRRAAFYSSLKSKVGLIAAKAAALRINMNTDSCLVASRTASRRLASSHAPSRNGRGKSCPSPSLQHLVLCAADLRALL